MKTSARKSRKLVYSVPLFTLLIFLYKLTLDFIYWKITSPIYTYYGFIMDFSLGKYVASVVLIIMMIPPMLSLLRRGNGSSLVIFLLNIVYFMPGLTLFALANLDSAYFLFFSLYWVILVTSQILLPRIDENPFAIKENTVIFNVIIIGFAFFAVMISGIYTGFRMNFSLSNVYDLRFSARELNLPTIAEYLLSASYVILPLGTMYYIVQKKKTLAILLLFVQFLSFSFNGKKSVLFTMLVVILIAKFYKEKRLNLIIPAFIGLNLIALFEAWVTGGTSEIARLIHRRVLFTPPLIGSYYFDFFSNNDLDYLSQSVLRWFGATSIYQEPIPRIIGLHYYNDIGTNANTGMVGDAFSNFGWLGLFYPFLIVFALRIFDKCSRNHDPRIIALMWVLLFYKFINGSFFTVMLTGGFIMVCIALIFSPRNHELITRKEFH